MNLGLPNQITGADAGQRLGFAGNSRVGLSPWPGVALALGPRLQMTAHTLFLYNAHESAPAVLRFGQA